MDNRKFVNTICNAKLAITVTIPPSGFHKKQTGHWYLWQLFRDKFCLGIAIMSLFDGILGVAGTVKNANYIELS